MGTINILLAVLVTDQQFYHLNIYSKMHPRRTQTAHSNIENVSNYGRTLQTPEKKPLVIGLHLGIELSGD